MNIISCRGLFFFVAVFCFISSCRENERHKKAAEVVNEWMGKEILFPENVPCYILGKETRSEICDDLFNREFKIVMYVDSAGCGSCRLQLFEWEQLMEEANRLFPGKVGFLIFFQPENETEMESLFEREGYFDHSVFIDIKGSINKLNHFSQEMQHQCFLLDKDNKVLMIGNPVLNPKIWELYKSVISGGKEIKKEILTVTKVDKTSYNYGIIPKGVPSSTTFTIMNAGQHPLVIYHISTSCGCTSIKWDKQPIGPGRSTDIHVEMTPDELGYFNKTIIVYCNTSESPIKFTIQGGSE